MSFGIPSGALRTMEMTMMNSISSAPSSSNRDLNINIYTEGMDLNTIMTRQMQDMLGMFSGLFGEVRTMFEDVHPDHFASVTEITPNSPHGGSLRDHYLKPGYNTNTAAKEDVDLDGKISSQEIVGLLKNRSFTEQIDELPSNEVPVPRSSFFQTIITQSVTKPDGSVETRRIVKDHRGTVEETVTSTHGDSTFQDDDTRIPHPFLHGDNIFRDFAYFWKKF